MAFRADEAAKEGFRRAKEILISPLRIREPEERERSLQTLVNIVQQLGPVVNSYPVWHPLVNRANDGRVSRYPQITTPNHDTGFRGLDHTVFFANGFLTCPYGDGQEVIDSVVDLDNANLEWSQRESGYPLDARLSAKVLEGVMYSPDVTPVLVTCEWEMDEDGTIPLKVAMPLFLGKELPNRATAQVSETWENMQSFYLGSPHGSISSLHINSETGRALKKAHGILVESGMFGPLYY